MYADYSAQYLINHGNVGDPELTFNAAENQASQGTLQSAKSKTHLMINNEKKFRRSPPPPKDIDVKKIVKSKYMTPRHIKQTINVMLN